MTTGEMTGDCLIIGGCGFLGTTVTRRLVAERRNVLVIDAIAPATPCAGARYLLADIRDRDALMRLAETCPQRPWVINLAARQYQPGIPRRGRQRWFSDTNVDGAMQVCRFAAELGATGLVQFSTDMVYGLPRTLPVTESHATHPLGEYGRSKQRMEQQVRHFADTHALPLTIFRPRLISGRGRLGIFTRLFTLIHRHLPVPLIGNGRNFYQMVSVDDCASAVLCAMDKGCPGAAYNLGSNPTLCVLDLMRELINRAESRSRIIPTPAPLIRGVLKTLSLAGIQPMYPEQYLLADKNFIVSVDKARTELGWQPTHDDLELLVAAYEYWKRLRHANGKP